ncbi:hypothetical protein OV203_47155 [Nannocystis sp. ILAH1]|uniref:hypothetical protein n=1 Tax=Nannocystis sp. ILAH1 TaxID=2996789 RepID=UPI00226FD942|nr:hypothetical protein [Nannocystis sp. ILAH1]MCY0994796.1 hypothetical protein [Nannocystis sp. ILAH1]
MEPQTTPPTAQFTTLGVTYQTTDGGCLCGKTQGVCWVANAGEVVFARPPPPAVHDQVRDAVMQHYAAEKAAREAAERAENEAATQAARTEAAAQARASKAAAKKAAVRKIAKAAAAAKTVAAAKGSRAAKPAKDSAPAKEAKSAKGTKATKPAKEAKPAKGRKAGHVRSSKPKPARGKRGTPKEDAPVAATKNETKPAAAKRSPEATPPAAPPGPVAWSDVEGKPRGVAGHGTFLIEPEGQGFALYFADPGGQSRHLRSGAMPELRRAAEEYAARGEPAPLRDAPSREQDEALMRIFASGAAEGA